MLKIRLRRMGSRHRPFYRVVVSDSRRTPGASALDELGFYDPRRSPSMFNVDMEKLDQWISRGAQPSETLSQLVKKARKGGFAEPAVEEKAEAPAEEKAEAPAEEKAEAAAEEKAEASADAEEVAADAEEVAADAEEVAADAEEADEKEA